MCGKDSRVRLYPTLSVYTQMRNPGPEKVTQRICIHIIIPPPDSELSQLPCPGLGTRGQALRPWALQNIQQLSRAVKDENAAVDGAESWMSNHLLVGSIHYS